MIRKLLLVAAAIAILDAGAVTLVATAQPAVAAAGPTINCAGDRHDHLRRSERAHPQRLRHDCDDLDDSGEQADVHEGHHDLHRHRACPYHQDGQH